MNKKNVKFASNVKGQEIDIDQIEPNRGSLMAELDEIKEDPKILGKNSNSKDGKGKSEED
jgi:hypothetical protein